MALDVRRHPEAGRLAEYVDHMLPAAEREEVERHLLGCAACREVVAETMAIEMPDAAAIAAARQTTPARIVPFRSRPFVKTVAAILAAAAALVLVVRLARPEWLALRPGTQRPELEELVVAFANEPTRPVEGRLTGGFKYAPPPSPTRGPGDREVSPDVRIAAANIEKRARDSETPEHEAALGVAYLALGNVDNAVRAIEHAVHVAPSNADFQNDLAAAYLARAVRDDRPDDWPRGLAAAERAIQLSPAHAEAHFNRALALTGLHLDGQARQALQDVLAVGGPTEWVEELRRRIGPAPQSHWLRPDEHLRQLTDDPASTTADQLVDQDPQFARELTDDGLMPQWADAWLAGDITRSNQSLRAARAIGRALAVKRHDPLTERAVALAEASSGDARLRVARAYVFWRMGRKAYADNDPAHFGPLFEDARRLFEPLGSPLALWCRHYAYVRAYFEGRIDDADLIARDVLQQAESAHSPSLTARLEWDLGSVAFQRARFGDAVTHWSQALALFESGGEPDNIAAMYQSLAECHGRLGDLDASWRAHRRALALSSTVRDIRRRQAVFTGPGYTALNADLPQAAVYFFLEASANAGQSGDPNYVFEAEVGAGRAFAQMRDAARARPILERAARLESTVTNPSYRTRFGADLRLALAELAERDRQPREVLRLTDDILTRVTSVSSEYRLASLHLMRARAQRELRDFAGAQLELETGITHLESKRALLQQEAQRISYLDSAWDLYAEVVGLNALDRGMPGEALKWADRGRSRALHDVLAATTHSDASPVVGEGDGLLFLMVTDRGLFSWLNTREHGVEFHHEPVTEERIARLSAAVNARRSDSPAVAVALAEAFDLLVRPFDESLARVERLTIVPDWTLQTIPFAALRDDRRRAFLVERMAVQLAPSLATAPDEGSRQRAAPRSIAVFVNPSRGAGGHGVSLPQLPFARVEASHIARSYPSATVFTGPDVTQARLARALGDFDVVHVATHAVADPQDRGAMRIALAEPDAPLDLSAVQPATLKSQVVVLAACSTSQGPRSRGEVIMSLARPFLASGVKHAVVTLANVEDESTAELMEVFHAHLSRGMPVAEALSAAQRDAARRTPGGFPWWGAFTVVSVR